MGCTSVKTNDVIMASPVRQIQNSPKKQKSPIIFPDTCPGGHNFNWMKNAEAKICKNCACESNAWYICKKCQLQLCTINCKTFEHNLETCPNNHDLIWTKFNSAASCDKCGKLSNAGFFCSIDYYFICSSNCKKCTIATRCINNHELFFKKEQYNKKCDLCGFRTSKIYFCQECDYIVCNKCWERSKIAKKKVTKSIPKLPPRGSPPKVINKQKKHNSPLKAINVSTISQNASKLDEMSQLVSGLLEQNAELQSKLQNVMEKNLFLKRNNSEIRINKKSNSFIID